MIRRLRKASSTSDSLVLTIPKYIVEYLELKEDSIINIETRGKKIIIDTNVNKQ